MTRTPSIKAHDVPEQGRPAPASAYVVLERGRRADGRVSRGRWVIVVETLRPTVREAMAAWKALRSPLEQVRVFWRVVPATITPGRQSRYHVRRAAPGRQDVG